MNSFWQSRSAGEKRSLMLLALFSLLLALWYGILQPLNKTILQQQQENARLKSEIQWVSEAAQRSGLVGSQPLTGDVPTLIQHSAAQAGLNVVVTPATPGHFTVALSAASSSAFFIWLDEMQNRGLQVSRLAFSAGSAPGSITIATLEFAQAGMHD
ncbi:type II secretion system protein GspM [Enterobacter sp.]|uniref:type II secretion system protein GspM n=1 Tax=Enterobacter sp. TaxID=42895 RepID=UPI00296E752C|nr:type II secretion system protein GspM [Enterobacter sp.]